MQKTERPIEPESNRSERGKLHFGDGNHCLDCGCELIRDMTDEYFCSSCGKRYAKLSYDKVGGLAEDQKDRRYMDGRDRLETRLRMMDEWKTKVQTLRTTKICELCNLTRPKYFMLYVEDKRTVCCCSGCRFRIICGETFTPNSMTLPRKTDVLFIGKISRGIISLQIGAFAEFLERKGLMG